MRISTKGRYSLEALLCLALLPPKEYASTRAIARETGISDGYLEQLFIPLREAGFIKGARGPAGGYRIGKGPGEISVGDILRAVEGPLEPAACVKAEICPKARECRTRPVWTEIYEGISACVNSISLQDLVTAYGAADQQDYMI